MPKRNWLNGALGGTPLDAERLNALEADVEAALVQLARDPSQLFAGSVTNDDDGAPISASVLWPDGVEGTYSGTASTVFPGAIDAYQVTRTGSPVLTYTQPAVTRDGSGNITNRPEITIT